MNDTYIITAYYLIADILNVFGRFVEYKWCCWRTTQRWKSIYNNII